MSLVYTIYILERVFNESTKDVLRLSIVHRPVCYSNDPNKGSDIIIMVCRVVWWGNVLVCHPEDLGSIPHSEKPIDGVPPP